MVVHNNEDDDSTKISGGNVALSKMYVHRYIKQYCYIRYVSVCMCLLNSQHNDYYH